jgi:hypothetical protein
MSPSELLAIPRQPFNQVTDRGPTDSEFSWQHPCVRKAVFTKLT